jgi:hypothetical protein
MWYGLTALEQEILSLGGVLPERQYRLLRDMMDEIWGYWDRASGGHGADVLVISNFLHRMERMRDAPCVAAEAKKLQGLVREYLADLRAASEG